ncbi:MAG TPA: HPr family phosphocarrier protein [Thermoanaerobaculia bacterium]|nr:HPr family phosphocarrier protein [Thermoanaerobaculia bacterium]
MINKDIEIINRLGLHARAAAKLVQTAARYASEIKVKKGDEEADGKSILGVLLLAAGKGTVITVTASGKDEQEAVDAIQSLIVNKFDESD